MTEPKGNKWAEPEKLMEDWTPDGIDPPESSASSESSEESESSDDIDVGGDGWPDDLRVIGNKGYIQCQTCGKMVCVNKLFWGSLHFCNR